jgi:hypothetical protein
MDEIDSLLHLTAFSWGRTEIVTTEIIIRRPAAAATPKAVNSFEAVTHRIARSGEGVRLCRYAPMC